MAKNKKEKQKTEKEESLVATQAPTRGRIFEGVVTKKFPKRVVLEFERTVFVQKYERFYKKKTRLHARVPDGMNINVGDYVKVQECRPLSKIIHFIVIEKVRDVNKEAKK
jgi:ribosomal protein S17